MGVRTDPTLPGCLVKGTRDSKSETTPKPARAMGGNNDSEQQQSLRRKKPRMKPRETMRNPKKTYRILRSLASWNRCVLHRGICSNLSPVCRQRVQGSLYYQPKQCTINGKSIKFTIYLHCLMPPKMGNLMIPGVQ